MKKPGSFNFGLNPPEKKREGRGKREGELLKGRGEGRFGRGETYKGKAASP